MISYCDYIFTTIHHKFYIKYLKYMKSRKNIFINSVAKRKNV